MDLRTPIGLLFAILGILLLAFGMTHSGPDYRPVGINVNLAWGGILLAFGIVMLLLARAASRSPAQKPNMRADG
jgi:hypothetical protein